MWSGKETKTQRPICSRTTVTENKSGLLQVQVWPAFGNPQSKYNRTYDLVRLSSSSSEPSHRVAEALAAVSTPHLLPTLTSDLGLAAQPATVSGDYTAVF